MQDRALDHPLEPGSGLRIGILVGLERLVFLIEILAHHPGQFLGIDTAGIHHRCRVAIVHKGQQQMLQRGIFVRAVDRVLDRGVEGLFEVLGETGHSGSLVLAYADCGAWAEAAPDMVNTGLTGRMNDSSSTGPSDVCEIWGAVARMREGSRTVSGPSV